MQEFFDVAEFLRLSKDEQFAYQQDLKSRLDYLNVLRYAKETAEEKGFSKGLEIGVKKGREEGMREGREEGIKEGIEKGKEEGMKEGIEKGKEEGEKVAKNRDC